MRRPFALMAILATLGAPPAFGQSVSDDPLNYGGQFPAATAALEAASLVVGGVARDVLVYRPSAAPAAPPVLIFFSGTGATLTYSTADEIGREWLQGFADREGAVLLFPMPRSQTHGDWDNHSADTPYWETAAGEGAQATVSADPDRNPDLLFTRALIKEAIQRYGADPGRIYVSGFSNGAMFSYFAAMALSSRIAAFAETGGGLILSHSTAGDPDPCVPTANGGSAGALRSCADTGWTPGTCQAASAIARPIAVPATGRVPPGFLRAHDDDMSVPYAHTCNLAVALSARTETSAAIAHQVGGHYVSIDFLESSWTFLRAHRLPAQTGWWWNPAESGRGYSIEINGNTLAMAAYLYEAGARAVWYMSAGALGADGGYRGRMQEYAGGQSLTGGYRPAGIKGDVSDVSLVCATASRCTLTWAGGVVPIERFIWDTNPAPAGAPETGWWWNAAEDGRGYFIEVQGNTLAATSYAYDTSGNAVWYLASGPFNGATFTGSWSEYGGGQTLTGAYAAPTVVNSNVGAVTIQLSDNANGTLTLPDGRQIAITRFRY